MSLKTSSVNFYAPGRYNCPECGGVDSFSVTDINGYLVFNCYKASCGYKGKVVGSNLYEATASRLYEVKNSPSDNVFIVPDYWVRGIANNACAELLAKYYCLDAYHKNWFKCGYDPKEDRIIIFITDSNMSVQGAIGRILRPRKGVYKVKNYFVPPVPFLCGVGSTLVIVEDVFSAISASRNDSYTGMAMLGTHFKKEYLTILKNYERVVIALDADAKNKAIKIKKLLDYYCSNVSLWFLDKDIKDMETI